MNFKSIATAAVIGLTTFAAPAEASFDSSDCKMFNDNSIMCASVVARMGSATEWKVAYSNGTGSVKEVFNIVCIGKRLDTWRSYGTMGRPAAESFSHSFCRA